jgi:predicted enzyme related to lactoylglutathione lyase
MKLWFNLLCRDIEVQFEFYRRLLDLPEAVASRSPIYRAIETEDFQFGFNAHAAYALLGIGDRMPSANDLPAPAIAYPTLMLDTPELVDAATRAAPMLGGQQVKGPFATYYGQWQAVLADPEGNVFRVASIALPLGVQAPPFPVPG